LYLILALCLLAPAVVIYAVRRDLRRTLAVAGLFGAAWGPLSEKWYLEDYWHPQSVGTLGGVAWVEDILFGAGVAAVASSIFAFVTNRRLIVHAMPRHRGSAVAFVVMYVAVMLGLRLHLKVNSIVVSCLVYLVCAFYIVARRRDLLSSAIGSALLMALVALIGYGVGLNWITDGKAVLQHIWLLNGRPLGVTILGHVPATEVAWYTCWGALLGPAYEYVEGAVLGSRRCTMPPLQGETCGQKAPQGFAARVGDAPVLPPRRL